METGDILQIVTNWILPDNEQAKNVFYAELTDDGGATDAQIRTQIRNYIDNCFEAMVTAIHQSIVPGIVDIYVRNTATDQWDRTGGSQQQFTPTGDTGIVSNQQAGVVYAFTENPRVTARKSLAGLADASLNVNTWTVGMQTALTNFAQRWINPINDEDIVLTSGCWSKKNNDFYPFSGAGQTNALEGSMDTRKP